MRSPKTVSTIIRIFTPLETLDGKVPVATISDTVANRRVDDPPLLRFTVGEIGALNVDDPDHPPRQSILLVLHQFH